MIRRTRTLTPVRLLLAIAMPAAAGAGDPSGR
jgi:hypothetical protein